ncbi:uncharacterized protein LOC126374171 [Pectinophora gossypiella]|nr:uncharacterized protein LOC126374171 [Pectinophora gossypiella]
MSKQPEITDEEFVPFLHSLGVETYKKSFEWMLGDPSFSGVFTWLYKNLDHNNALTTREQYRYSELEKNDYLLSDEDLESTLAAIKEEYPGISIPGDLEALEDVKFDINVQKEKLHALEKQERVYKELIKQNELSKEQLTIETTKLQACEQQYLNECGACAEQCLSYAQDVEARTDSVLRVIATALQLYASTQHDKETAQKFVSFGPLEQYRQSQALFKSHFDLYTARKFHRRQNDSFTDDDLRTALVEARNLEDRLSDAATAYIESLAELCGEQAKLELVGNYNNVHPSQITTYSVEAQTALELLVQEEAILDQQIQDAIKEMVTSRTKLAVDTTIQSALAVREQINTDLSRLLDTSHQALSLDRLLYCALRVELRALLQLLQFAAQLRAHATQDAQAVTERIESMNEILSQQQSSTANLQHSDILLHTLRDILGAQSEDAVVLVKMYNDLHSKLALLATDVREGYAKKEEAVEDLKKASGPLREYISTGCTRQPQIWDRTVAALTHSLTRQLTAIESTVLDVGGLFSQVKNGDKQNLRKLWQWFLTDPPRLQAAVKGVQTGGYA